MKILLLALLLLTLTAHAATVKIRYFLVSYSYAAGTGTIGVTGTTFPSKASIAQQVRTAYADPSLRISIISISEFKTKTDYTNYFAGSPVSEFIVQAHDTVRISVPVPAPYPVPYAVHDTLWKASPPIHDTLWKHDTIPPTARTWYLRDLHILPNTGQCLTNRVQQVIDSAVAMGGQTTIVISDEGTYNMTMPADYTSNRAAVTLTYSCYPGEDKVTAISVEGCN